MKRKKVIVIFLIVIFSAFLLSGVGIFEPYLNIRGYQIEMYKTHYSEDGYFFVIENNKGVIEAKKFDRGLFITFYLKDDFKKYGIDNYYELLDSSPESPIEINKLNLIWHEAYFENYNCTFGPDAERSDNPCKIENEDENKLFLEYESFLKELGIREKSLLNMLIYKLNHPTNNLIWSKFATNLDE